MIRWQPTRWSARHWAVLAVILALSPVVASLRSHPWWLCAAIIAWVSLMNLLPVPDLSSWVRKRKTPLAHNDGDDGEASG
jgi:hypothetical protein